jgi:hypothetical protein
VDILNPLSPTPHKGGLNCSESREGPRRARTEAKQGQGQEVAGPRGLGEESGSTWAVNVSPSGFCSLSS